MRVRVRGFDARDMLAGLGGLLEDFGALFTLCAQASREMGTRWSLGEAEVRPSDRAG